MEWVRRRDEAPQADGVGARGGALWQERPDRVVCTPRSAGRRLSTAGHGGWPGAPRDRRRACCTKNVITYYEHAHSHPASPQQPYPQLPAPPARDPCTAVPTGAAGVPDSALSSRAHPSRLPHHRHFSHVPPSSKSAHSQSRKACPAAWTDSAGSATQASSHDRSSSNCKHRHHSFERSKESRKGKA